MKRILLFGISLLASAGIIFATSETVYLKNGSVIKGKIIEMVPDESVKIETKDGNVFVYQADEVEKIEQTEKAGNTENIPKQFSFGVLSGIGVGDGATIIPLEFTFTRRWHKYFGAGIGVGVDFPTGDGKPLIPIFADVKGYLPLSSTSILPFLDMRLGYVINTQGEQTVGSGKYKVEVPQINYTLFSLMPGVRIPVSRTVDLDFALGYEMYAPSESGYATSNMFGARIGFNFHKAVGEGKPKVVIPTRDTGFIFGLGGYGGTDAGVNLLLGYRLSKKLTAVFGFGMGGHIGEMELPASNMYYNGDTYLGEDASTTEYSVWYVGFNFFLRGEYRFNTNKFSPFVSLDLGYTNNPSMPNGDDAPWKDLDETPDWRGFFTRPAVGISWRCTNNSYLKLAAGYKFIAGFGSAERTRSYGGVYDGSICTKVVEKVSAKTINDFNISLTWERTFGLFSKNK